MVYMLYSIVAKKELVLSLTDGNSFKAVKGEGLVNEVFNEEKLKSLKGNAAIAHVRYATAGGGGI